jgi:hypothetical protein
MGIKPTNYKANIYNFWGYIWGYAENHVINNYNDYILLGYMFDPPHPKKVQKPVRSSWYLYYY